MVGQPLSISSNHPKYACKKRLQTTNQVSFIPLPVHFTNSLNSAWWQAPCTTNENYTIPIDDKGVRDRTIWTAQLQESKDSYWDFSTVSGCVDEQYTPKVDCCSVGMLMIAWLVGTHWNVKHKSITHVQRSATSKPFLHLRLRLLGSLQTYPVSGGLVILWSLTVIVVHYPLSFINH